jgi:hypothetical protein
MILDTSGAQQRWHLGDAEKTFYQKLLRRESQNVLTQKERVGGN